jgi:hypothetical protein
MPLLASELLYVAFDDGHVGASVESSPQMVSRRLLPDHRVHRAEEVEVEQLIRVVHL